MVNRALCQYFNYLHNHVIVSGETLTDHHTDLHQ